jgi:hypothetical protein
VVRFTPQTMNRFVKSLSRAVLALAVAVAPAEAQAPPEPVKPPAEVPATLVPVYHEGHAYYWYKCYWWYRDANDAWTYFPTDEVPAFLRTRGLHCP